MCVFGVFENDLSYFDKKIQKCPQTCLRNTKRAKQRKTDEQDFVMFKYFPISDKSSIWKELFEPYKW